MGSTSKAIDLMEAAIAKKADIPQFYTFYASLLDDDKQVAKALGVLAGAAKLFEKNDQIFFFLGSIQDKSGMRKECLESMKKSIELNPENVQALNYLGYTMTDMDDHLVDAQKYIERALKLKPQDAYITDSYGWLLFREGKFKESITVLEGAYKLKTDEAIIAEHLGDAYLRFSLPDKARQMYIRAATLETDEKNLKKIKGKIADIDTISKPERSSASVEESSSK